MTLQLELEPKLAHQLEKLATQQHNTPEEFILELLRREVEPKRIPSWVGMANSGRSDLGSSTEELVFESLYDAWRDVIGSVEGNNARTRQIP